MSILPDPVLRPDPPVTPTFTERFNKFLYKQQLRKLGADIESAREWCLDLIRREHPHLTEEQRERFYHNLISVRINAVDEWTRRMS